MHKMVDGVVYPFVVVNDDGIEQWNMGALTNQALESLDYISADVLVKMLRIVAIGLLNERNLYEIASTPGVDLAEYMKAFSSMIQLRMKEKLLLMGEQKNGKKRSPMEKVEHILKVIERQVNLTRVEITDDQIMEQEEDNAMELVGEMVSQPSSVESESPEPDSSSSSGPSSDEDNATESETEVIHDDIIVDSSDVEVLDCNINCLTLKGGGVKKIFNSDDEERDFATAESEEDVIPDYSICSDNEYPWDRAYINDLY